MCSGGSDIHAIDGYSLVAIGKKQLEAFECDPGVCLNSACVASNYLLFFINKEDSFVFSTI